MLSIQAIPALGEHLNYIWLIQPENKNTVLIVDPGEAAPVIEALTSQNLTPIGILITHHHWDHVNGVAELVERYQLPVYGPKHESIPHQTYFLTSADTLTLPDFPAITILDIPGHTEGHIAYLTEGHLFCGDTLFGAGCGRLLGGTAAQLYDSLQHIMTLPPCTKIYCGHEYTADNLRFAQIIEPDNTDIAQRTKEIGRCIGIRDSTSKANIPFNTLPSTLALEILTNPFLRCHLPSVHAVAESYARNTLTDPLAVFTILRDWKTHF